MQLSVVLELVYLPPLDWEHSARCGEGHHPRFGTSCTVPDGLDPKLTHLQQSTETPSSFTLHRLAALSEVLGVMVSLDLNI